MILTEYRAGQIWLHTYPVRLAGTSFEARMTVVRLTSGDIMLHSPCDITSAVAQEISALGPVTHIVVPGNFHHLHARSAQVAFPHAKTWICPGTEKRAPGLKYDAVLSDESPEAWRGEIDQVVVQGSRIMREAAMYHRASRSLILVDLIENFTDATPRIGGALKFWFKHVMRMWNNPRPAPEYRMGWDSRAAAAQSLKRILAWDFDRIIISHGDLIEHDAHAAATAAWSSVLGS